MSSEKTFGQHVKELHDALAPFGTFAQPMHKIRSRELRDLYESYSERHEFSAGDLVQWKPGMKNMHRPCIDEPAIVIETRYGRAAVGNPGTQYEDAPSDTRIGVVADDVLEFFWVDGNRLMPWAQDE